jgi:hypothetical protein
MPDNTQKNSKLPIKNKGENLVNRKAVLAKGPVNPKIRDYNPDAYVVTDVAPYNANSPDMMSARDMWNQPLQASEVSTRRDPLRTNQIYQGNKYDSTFVGTDYEEMHGQQQGAGDKWFNAATKMVGTIGTTMVSGTAGLVYGIGDAIINQRLASVVDNDITRGMDNISKGLEDSNPNFYTKQETEADWWSPDNIMTANFWSDKVLKNLGFSIGSMGGGLAWGALFKSIGLTNKLVRAGRGMEASAAVEKAIATAPKASKFTAMDKALKALDKTIKQPAGAVLRDSERILVSVMGTSGEATIEGLGAMTEMENKMNEQFKLEHGRMPTAQEASEMKGVAERAGMYVWGMNALILTGTNYIQLGKIVGSSRKADKALINNVRKNAEGVWEAATPKSILGKAGATAKHAGRLLFAPVEAVEEGLQFAATTGVDEYFSKAYENQDAAVGFLATLSEVMQHVYVEGLTETLTTKEGLEGMLIGALSGGMQQAGIIGSYKGKDGKTKYGIGRSGNIGEYGITGTGGERGKNTAQAITDLNQLTAEKALKDGVDFMGIGIGSQEKRQAAIENDDKVGEKNAEADYAMSYLMPRIKYGKLDSALEELNNYRSQASNPEGFAELQATGIASQNETAEKFVDRIDGLVEMAETIDKNYETLNDRYENLIDENGEAIYSSEIIDKMVYTAAKVQDFDKRILELQNELLSTGVDLTILNEKVDKGETITQADVSGVANTADNVGIVEQETFDENLTDYAELLLQRKQFAQEYKDIREAPLDHKTAEAIKTPKPSKEYTEFEEVVTVNTANGPKSYSKGFYYSGRVPADVVHSGATRSAPFVEIIGQNKDGTIKAKFPNGDEMDLTEDQLEYMELGSVTATKDNKKAEFYVDNWNTPYKMNFGENGGYKEGRIVYNEDTDKMNFVYVDASGNTREIEVTNDQFAPNGEEAPQIQRVQPANKAQAVIEARFLAATDERKDKKHEDSLKVLGEFLDETEKKHEKTKASVKVRRNNLDRTKKKIAELHKDLATKKDKRSKGTSITYTKAGKAILTTIRRMEKDIIALEKEVLSHTADLEDIGVTLAYVQDLIDNIDEHSTDLGDFIEGIKKNGRHLQELQKQTKANLVGIEKYIEEVKEFVTASKNVLHDLLNQLGIIFPSVSREGIDLTDDITVEDYLADLANLTGSATEGDKLAFAGVNIDQVRPKKNLLNKLDKSLVSLENELSSLEKDIAARTAVLEKFGELQELRKTLKEEEEALINNPVITEDVLNTLDPSPSPPTPQEYNEEYEVDPKKNDYLVVTSTVAPVGMQGRPVGVYADRAQAFGNKFHNLEENGKKFKGSIITKKTENDLIPGLTAHLIGESGLDPRTVIVMVVTDQAGIPIDENGDPIAEVSERLEKGIYQVFPTEKLAMRGITMFRADTPLAERERLTEAYTGWRERTLKATKPESQDIGASFGILDLIEILDEQGKVDVQASAEARSSSAEAGLMENHVMQDEGVIMVGTDEGLIENGSSSFKAQEGKSLLGHVFLKVPGGLAKLFNQKNDKKQAENIYNVLVQITKNIANDGNGKGDATQDLFKWLKTVVYWGTPSNKEGPKEPADGSVWYEVKNNGKGTAYERKLRIGKTSKFDFTPASLELHKDSIISLLQEVYGNTHKPSVDGNAHNNTYAQITGIKKDGTPQVVLWPNYQSYLLADKSPDPKTGKLTVARSNDDIPLKTKVRPLVGPEDKNKRGIYFSLDNKTAFEPAPIPPVTKKVPTKTGTKTVKSEGFVFNGIVENTVPLGALGEAYVKMDMDKATAVYAELEGKVFGSSKELQEFAEKLVDKKILEVKIDKFASDNIIEHTSATTVEEAEQWAKGEVIKTIKTDIVAAAVKQIITPVKPEVAPGITMKDLQNLTIALSGTDVAPKHSELFTTFTPKDQMEWLERNTPISSKASYEQAIAIAEAELTEPHQKLLKDVYAYKFPKVVTTTGFKLDGSEEVLDLGANGKLPFTLDRAALEQEIEEDPTVTNEENRQALLGRLMESGALEIMPEEELYLKAYDAYGEKGATANLAKGVLHFAVQQVLKEREIAAAAETLPEDVPVDDADAKRAAAKAALAKRFKKPKKRTDRDTDDLLREKLKDSLEPFKAENWRKVSKWMTENFPNIALYRVQNVIQSTNGKQAYGLYRQGAAYVYKNAEAGTAYHEVFHAVWDMFVSPKEKQAIRKEFRDRNGSYNDRFTQEEIKFAEATDAQMNEELAEEFREKVLYDKEPKRKPKSLIKRLFADLIEFFNTFFFGKDSYNNTQKLFNKMGNGDYAAYIPQENALEKGGDQIRDIENIEINNQDQLRVKFEGIPAKQEHEIYQHMTHKVVTDLIRSKEGLFGTTQKLKIGDHYPALLEELVGDDGIIAVKQEKYFEIVEEDPEQFDAISKKIYDLDTLKESIIANWDIEGGIKERHMASLNPYEIAFDTTEDAIINDESTPAQDVMESNKIDSFKKANAAIKLLFATLPDIEIDSDTQKAFTTPSSIGGVTFEQSDKVYITLLNAIHDSVGVDDMLAKLKKLGQEPNGYHYANLYLKLTKESVNQVRSEDNPIDSDKMDQDSLRLLVGFWKTMKKQNPDVPIVYILEDGSVEVGDTTLSNASKQLRFEMGQNIVTTLKEDAENDELFFKKAANGLYSPTTALKNKKFDSKNLNQFVLFLKAFEIDFTVEDLVKLKNTNPEYYTLFLEATNGLLKNIQKMDGFRVFNMKELDSSKRLLQLGSVSAKINTPMFESTHFGLDGERTQNFIGPNATSDLYDTLSVAENKEDLRGTRYEHLLTDVFSQGSLIMQRLFNSVSGKRTAKTRDVLKPIYVGGTNNEITNKKIPSSRLKYGDRLAQDINLNLTGIYSNLVPGDSELDHGLKMHAKDSPFMSMDAVNRKDYLMTFRGYFVDEVNLARDERIVPKKRNAEDLRFFKDIFDASDPSLHEDIMSEPSNVTPEALYDKYEKRINAAVEDFIIQDTEDTKRLIWDYKLVQENTLEPGTFVSSLGFEQQILSKDNIAAETKKLTVNYMIANIEQHKLLYSDPYQYSDELKRIKNFNSPRQALLHGSTNVTASFHEVYNEGFEEGDLGYSDMKKESFSTITVEDVFSSILAKGYEDINKGEGWEETDGAGMISFQAHRIFKIRAGEWTPKNEEQYRYDIEYQEKIEALNKASEEDKLSLYKIFEAFKDSRKEHVKSTYTPSKPIVSGNKGNDRNYNDLVLDKYALFPLSFRIFHEMDPNSNILKFTEKMRKEKMDYAVYQSGRKVGVELTYPLYVDGKLNTEPFQTVEEKEQVERKNPEDRTPRRVTEIPFSIMSLQTEVPSKGDNRVTQGSQITKLATLDSMDGGVPVDYLEGKDTHEAAYAEWSDLSEEDKKKESFLYKEIQHNKSLLEEKIRIGYNGVLEKLGISEGDGAFTITDKPKMIATIKKEIAKQEMNNNLIDAFEGVEEGDVLLEATPVYQQIRSTLYSIANNNVIKPKITGGMKVQMPSTLFESGNRIIRGTSKKGNQYLHSDTLGFYERETRAEDGTLIKAKTAEIMVGRWFKSDKSDDELIEYLNNTPEGQRVLNGVAFRTPTQKQNSIEAFRVKKFLPAEYGDSVVIPSAITRKTGSDFDIDKLSIYLKNTYTGEDGFPKVVPYFGMDEVEAKKKYRDLLKKEDQDEVAFLKALGLDEIFDKIDEAADESNESWIDRIYAKGIENEYVESLERLVMHPQNFDNLIKPNSAEELKELTEHINQSLDREEIDFTSPGFMLSRKNMSGLRNAFVGGKKAIGVGAVGQTNHANNQGANVFVDTRESIMPYISSDDQYFLNGMTHSKEVEGSSDVKFQEYNKVTVDGIVMPSLSRVKNAAGDTISDIIGMFIDGYVDISKGPWIMQMGATPQTAGTWLFLAKIGVPIKTVAYFMNQPIISELLLDLEVTGSSWIFNADKADTLIADYSSKQKEDVEQIPTEDELDAMMGMEKADMSELQKKQQQLILKEFLKVSTMSNHLLKVTQGTNFDTATLNDPFLVFKKAEQLKIARNTVISSADNILDGSFLGTLNTTLDKLRDAFSQILLSDKNDTDKYSDTPRSVLERVLLPYVEMSDRNFVGLSQRVVSDFFDWAMQTDKFSGTSINAVVGRTLLGTETEESAAKQIIEFKESVFGKVSEDIPADETHPLHGNMALDAMMLIPGGEVGVPDNITIKGKDNKVYDQNQIINSFVEIKDYLESNPESKYVGLYKQMVRLAILQTGLSSGPVAFSKLLPYEDFKNVYNDSLERLEGSDDISNYADLKVFERNNWYKGDWVPAQKKVWIDLGYVRFSPTTDNVDPRLKAATEAGEIPRTIFVNEGKNDANDVIVYKWSDNITAEERLKRAKTKDTRHIHKTLMRKVYRVDEYGEREPLIQTHKTKKNIYRGYVYVAINAWGDSFRAKEFYNYKPVIRGGEITAEVMVPPSVLNNGFDKVIEVSNNVEKFASGEVSDRTIVSLLSEEIRETKTDVVETAEVTTSEVKETVPLKKAVSNRILKADIAFAKDQVDQGILAWSGDKNSSRIDLDMPRADITAGVKAIKAGKKTKNAMRVTLALKKAKETGFYNYMQGSGGTTNKLQVPIVDTTGQKKGDPAQTDLFEQDLSEQEFNQEDNEGCPF